MDVEVIQGDIAQQSADCLVNAAGTSLRMGSGVAGALRREGGEAMNRDAVANVPVDLGATAVTDAYDLDARYVIHAAAMPHYGDGRDRAKHRGRIPDDQCRRGRSSPRLSSVSWPVGRRAVDPCSQPPRKSARGPSKNRRNRLAH